MSDPDELLRSLEYTVFMARAGLAMDINGLSSTTRIPASPLTGLCADQVILIHMVGYEDWTPRSPNGSSSRTSSGTADRPPLRLGRTSQMMQSKPSGRQHVFGNKELSRALAAIAAESGAAEMERSYTARCRCISSSLCVPCTLGWSQRRPVFHWSV